MHVLNVSVPCALGVPDPTPDDVRALVNLVRRTSSTADNRVTTEMVAMALGVTRQTLWSWMRPARAKPGKRATGRGITYCAMFVLQALATNPVAARDDAFAAIRASLTAAS